MSDGFASFGLSDPQPVWSSFALEQAIEGALESGSAEELMSSIFERLGARADLSPAHAHFVRDFVKALVLRLGAELGERQWLVEAARASLTPAQALLAVYLLPAAKLEPEALLSILRSLDPTPYFTEAVVQLQDSALRSEFARHLFTNQPELAKRVRAALSR